MHFSPATRLRFAFGYALRHLLISVCVALVAALFVFGLLYPPPFSSILGVGSIFFLLLAVDVVCGPLLTLVLASPSKSPRERWLDFSLVGLVQLAALLYGLHSVWAARPVVLAFEVDRLVIATANEVQADDLGQAPSGLQHLPWWGTLQVGTRAPQGGDELFASVNLSMQGITPAMRPGWWLPWSAVQDAMRTRTQPLQNLLQRRPQDAAALQAAIAKTGLPADQLRYLPLVSSKTRDWIALLDKDLHIVGYAPVDGFGASP